MIRVRVTSSVKMMIIYPFVVFLILTKFIVILSKLSIANSSVLIDNAAYLNDACHAGGVSSKLNYLDLTFYKELGTVKGGTASKIPQA
jgi:hypothetical protein